MKQEMTDILIEAAKAGGKILLSYYKTDMIVTQKSSKRDLLTQADLESQKIIIETLTKLMIENGFKEEEIGFIAEENFTKKGTHTFIIDPLDGTSGFVEGSDAFTVSIGYYYNFEAKTGVVYLPVKDIIYTAEKAKGAYKIENGQRTKLQIQEKELKDSLVAFNTNSDTTITQMILQKITNLVPHVYRVRENPCITVNLMGFVENHYQIVINGRAKLWDIAAAKLIIEEAGGKLVNWEGGNFDYAFSDINVVYPLIASQPGLITQVVKYLHE